MNTKRILSGFLSLLCLCATAQTYTLRQCVECAIQQNVDVKRAESTQRLQEINLSTARNARLPNLSGSAGQNWNFGRSLTIDNTYANYNTAQTSFSLSTSVPLFTGFQIPNNTALAKLNLEAAIEDVYTLKDNLSIQVAQAYLTVLFNKELRQTADAQVTLAKQQLDRKQAFADVEKATASDVAEAKSLVAQRELTAVQAANDYDMAVLDLVQLMEIAMTNDFQVADIPDTELNMLIEKPEEVYRIALTQRHNIKAAELRIESAEKSIKLAKSQYYPQLNFNAGIGTGYYHTSGLPSASFGTQMRENFSQYLGLTLSVPIFNRLQTRNSVRRAQEERLSSQLALDKEQINLFKEIQQAYYSVVSAKKKYASSQTALKASEEAFNLTRGRYEHGKATATEFAEAQYNVMLATSEMLKAKYEAIFRHKILNFYKGAEME